MFNDRIVWVTGAGSGIGEATAKAFAKKGATVILSGRRANKLDTVASEIAKAGGKAHALAGDLANPETSRQTAAFIKDTFGHLDILVNNAGHNITKRSWDELNSEGIDEVIGTNLSVPFYCATAALLLMWPRRRGLLIHISSIDGNSIGLVGGPAYAAAKHGVMALSHTLNLAEAKNGIRSCVICPGGVDTEILDKRPVKVSVDERATLLKPADLADLILYIAGTPPHVRIEEVTITPMPA